MMIGVQQLQIWNFLQFVITMVVSMMLIPGDFELLGPVETLPDYPEDLNCSNFNFFLSYYLYYFLGIFIMASLAPQFKWLERSSKNRDDRNMR